MAIEVAAIRTAIIERAEGRASESVRSVPVGVFRFGVFDGQPTAAQIAKAIQTFNARNWINVTVSRTRDHASTPVSAIGSRRNSGVTVAIDVWTHAKTVAQEAARVAVLDEIAEDCEALIQALHFPGNLAATLAGVDTTLIGGFLCGPGFQSAPEYLLVSEDWRSQMIRSRIDASGVVEIAQAVA